MRKDLTGKKFGRLTLIERVDDVYRSNGKPRSRYLCECECGKRKIIFGENLTSGKTKSCGCLQKEKTSERVKTHGETDSRLYNVWCAIKRRCYNPNCKEYKYYGGRNITMCEEWKNNYSVFRDWAIGLGYDPTAPRGEYTIDRIDVNGNYEPSNCRLATVKTQMNNTRSNHILELNGVAHTISEWSEITNLSQSCISQRINIFGYDVETALTKPSKRK